MKRKNVFAAVVLMCALQAPSWGVQLLVNPGLDDPPLHESDSVTGWTLVEPDLDGLGSPVNSAVFVTFRNHNPGGTRALWYRSFVGGLGGAEPLTVNAHLYQDVPGIPGAAYTLSAWYLYEAFYPGTNPLAVTDTFLALEFLDAGAGILASLVQNADDFYPGTNDWFQVVVNGVAPAGTVVVRARSSMIDGFVADGNPQSAFVDDFELLVPEPAAALLLAPALVVLMRRRRPHRR